MSRHFEILSELSGHKVRQLGDDRQVQHFERLLFFAATDEHDGKSPQLVENNKGPQANSMKSQNCGESKCRGKPGYQAQNDHL